MDFKDPTNKEELKNKINSTIEEYRDLLINLTDDPNTYKKSALLYYWLRDYKNYIKNEDTFDPKYYPEFYRGSIVNINFGFNLGSELGGLHYAIVLKDSNKKNPNITVVPLTSLKRDKDIKELRPTELYLGQELYFKIQRKIFNTISFINSSLKSCHGILRNTVFIVMKAAMRIIPSGKMLPFLLFMNTGRTCK